MDLIAWIIVVVVVVPPSEQWRSSYERVLETHTCEEEECLSYASELIESLNQSADPCEDFFEYSCGGWRNKHQIDNEMFTSLFRVQENTVRQNIRTILETSRNENGSAMGRAQEMYRHCLDLNETEGIDGILKTMKAIGGWPMVEGKQWDLNNQHLKSTDHLLTLLAQFRRRGQVSPLFTVSVEADLKHNTKKIITFSQPSANKLYSMNYLTTENRIGKIASIVNLVKSLNASIDEGPIIRDAEKIFDLNNFILDNLLYYDDKDMNKSYLKITIAEFIHLTRVNWLHFLNVLFDSITTFNLKDEIVLLSPKYFLSLSDVLLPGRFKPRTIINFELTKEVAFHYTLANAAATVDRTRCSRQTHCLPRTEPIFQPKWMTCVVSVEKCFENALAWKYGEWYLNRKSVKKETLMIARNIFSVFSERLKTVSWLDEESRSSALDKLTLMSDLHLYPEWASNEQLINHFYKELQLTDNFIGDVFSYQKFIATKKLQKLVTLPNHLIGWPISPLRVDAVYLSEENAVHVLEGILQPPLFSPDRLKVMNYGTLGTIIGHEVIHGFDMIGIQFDKYGNLNKWITPNSIKRYLEKEQCFIEQYSNYSLTSEELPGSKGYTIDGFYTVNENIADNGGLQTAYWAYKKWIRENGEEILPNILQQFTVDQVFFLSFAHTWCLRYGNYTNWENVLSSDKHSPQKFRIVGAISNFEEFPKAFNCDRKNPSENRKKTCQLW